MVLKPETKFGSHKENVKSSPKEHLCVLSVASQLYCLQSVSFLLSRGKPDSAQSYRMPISVTTEKPKAVIIQVPLWIVINSEFTIKS